MSGSPATPALSAGFFHVLNSAMLRHALFAAALLVVPATAEVRDWTAVDGRVVKGEFIKADPTGVTIRRADGRTVKLPADQLSGGDLAYADRLAKWQHVTADPKGGGLPRPTRGDFEVKTQESVEGKRIALQGGQELHLTGAEDPLAGGSVDLTAPDSFLVLEKHRPSVVEKEFLNRITVNGKRARDGGNARVVAYAGGSIIVPHESRHPAVTLFAKPQLAGGSLHLECFKDYDDGNLRKLEGGTGSFILRRGYMATFAENKDGTGFSKNWVAQDHDVVVDAMPEELRGKVGFIRVFPWRWTAKKGIAGGIHEKLALGWFYNWNISDRSTTDLEYVPIRQKRDWPGLDHDWEELGSLHLLGFNEPDRPDQANMKVDDAIALWPQLMKSGLRVGSPAVSDGGLGWLYDFMQKADKAKLRVDFVAVHYYRAVGDPANPAAAADQIYRFCKEIHDRTGRPIWLTEWNNGANWTKAPDPTPEQQRAAIKAMITKLDEAPFVERYALYNLPRPHPR